MGGLQVGGRQVKAMNVEYLVDGHLRVRAALDGRAGVDAAQPRVHTLHVLCGHEIRLVEQQTVGKRHLRCRLVDHALRLLLIQMLFDVLGIDQRDDAVNACERLDGIVQNTS